MRTGFDPAEARSLLEESGLDCAVATSHDNVYYTTHSEIMTISMRARAEVHDAVRTYYESQGHEYTRAFIGHGLGIGCHEAPFLGPSHGDWPLKPGMFFQVEPSLTLGRARVHTEDSFIVQTRGGAKNVSEYRDITELQRIR